MPRTNRILLLFISLFFLPIAAMLAQGGSSKKVTLSGVVLDDQGAFVPYATAALYNPSDSSMVDGTTSGNKGRFEVEVAPGNYYLKVNFLSFEEKVISDLDLTSGSVDLGEIELRSGAVNLNEAVIEGERGQMELKLDKRVFNVGQDMANIGTSAAETLDNLPSVNLDVDGNVSLRGSGNVQILIDGKPSGLIGMDPANALRQIPSDMIERVEVITNPSARYQAEGEVGIINIILKKEDRKGLNGTFTANAGVPENLGASFNLNFRREKINWFAQYGFRYQNRPGGGTTFQDYSSPDTTYSFERRRDHVRGGLSNNFRAGADIFLNDKNTLTLSGLYSISDGTNTVLNRYRDFAASGEQVEETIRDEEEAEDEQTIEGALTYTKTFDKDEHKWETMINFYQEEDTEQAELIQTSDNSDVDPTYQRTYNEENEQNFLFQSDYIRPLGEDGKFETGVRITNRQIENVYKVELRSPGQDWDVVDSLDNDFIYLETIYAAYMMYGNKIGKFSYQGGLRAEYSDIGTELVKSEESNNRDYLNFFPSVHLSYEINQKNSVQLTYSRRLSRPHFRSLLPFSNFSDNRNFYRGNPNLDPEYTDSYEAGYLVFGEVGSLLSSVYYRHRTGVVQRISVVDDRGFTTRLPVNLGVEDAYGLEFNLSLRPFEWMNVNGDFNFYRSVIVGEYAGENLNADTYTWSSRLTAKSTIWDKLNVQLSGRYRAPRITPQGRRKSIYSVDFAASTDILKGNGTISLSVSDIFNSRRYRGITEGEYFYQESDFQWRSQQLMASFTYRLNQRKSNRPENGGDGYDGEM